MSVTAYVENHYSFKTNNDLANICHKLNNKLSYEDSSKKNNRKLTGLKSNRINARNNFNIFQNSEIYAANKSMENKNSLDKPKIKKLSAPKPNSNTSTNNSNTSNGFVNILFLLIIIVASCFLVSFITYIFLTH